ncbi:MAG: 16S rRNA (cytosine(967)-C(5))-methyltransferase RsmB [Pseudomonadota bacterium]
MPPVSASPARLLASELVNAVLLEGRSLTQTLADLRSRKGFLDPRNLAAAQSLAYGTLRQAGRLHFFIQALAGRPLAPDTLLGPLMVGLHELDNQISPAYAAVNETVAVVAHQTPRARGFANAILRNFQRRRDELVQQAEADPQARWNFPAWWLARLEGAYPDAWQDIVETLNGHPPMTLRVNRRRADIDDFADTLAQAGLACRRTGPEALTLEHPVPVSELSGFPEGLVSVQDLGAQMAAPLLDCADGMRVLDACAAPGGKTAHLLERHDLDLLALDKDPQRLAQVTEGLTRLGLRAAIQACDAAATDTWWDGRPFDRILLDAPCTASGVVRRHPDGKWLKRAEDMQQLAREQTRLLEALWPLLKPGGKILYATCSLFPAENQDQITAFLARHGDAHLDPAGFPEPCDGGGPCQLLPGQDMDGFFYARLLKP